MKGLLQQLRKFVNAINAGMAGGVNWFLQSKNYVYAAPVLFGLISIAIVSTGALERFENITVDWRIRAVADSSQNVDERLVFIAIGDESIDKLGRWPWRRVEHSLLLDSLKHFPPRVIAYDILFADLSRDRPNDDIALALTSVNLGVLVFASHLEQISGQAKSATETVLKDFQRVNLMNREDFGFSLPLPNVIGKPDETYVAEEPILPFVDPDNPDRNLAGSGFVGFVDCLPDFDGVRRRVPLLVKVGEEYYPSLVTQSLMVYWNLFPEDIDVEFGKHLTFNLPDADPVVVPITYKGELLVNWRRLKTQDWDGEGYDTREFSDFVSFAKDSNAEQRHGSLDGMEDKILVVGQNAIGLSDVGPTPLQPRTPLSTVHLNAINTILQRDFINVVPVWPVLAVWFVVAFGSCWLLRQRSIALATGIPVILLVSYVVAAYFVYLQFQILIPIVWPALSFGVLHVGAGAIRWLEELRQRLEIRGVFSSYVSGPLLDHLLENPDAIELGGKIRPVSCFFSDIRSFTTISETMDPEAAAKEIDLFFDAGDLLEYSLADDAWNA
ncbi:MAG: CHASE2 domain-containing protein, partial [Verrucomicrobiota bacterium]